MHHEVLKVQPQVATAEASANQELQEQALMRKHRQMYQNQVAMRQGELTKDLDAFYTIFIKQFHGMEREITTAMRSLTGVGAVATASQYFDNGPSQDATFFKISPQLKEILMQVSMEPFLVNLLPHMIKFVESKSQALMDPTTEPVAGDVQLHNLILQVLRSVYANKFFDLDFSLKTVIPILMKFTLCSRFHP